MLSNFWAVSAEAGVAIAATAVSAVAVIVTIVFYFLNRRSEKAKIIMDKYDELYSNMFGLRKSVSEEIGYQWYYEISAIANNAAAKDLVTGAVNSICNIFVAFYRCRYAKKLWLRLMPPKLFERLFALYPFIVYMRKANNDPQLFQAYCDMIDYCCGKKKFKDRYFDENKIVWVGIRQSDVRYAQTAVKDSITVFGKPDTGLRPNQNVGDCYSKLIDEIYARENNKENEYYMFYNPKLAYALNENVRKRVLALNPPELLGLLNDKLQTRADFAAKNVRCVPSEEIYATDLDYKDLCKRFNTDKIVIQKAHGGGGYGTYLIDSANAATLLDTLKKQLTTFLVSPYMQNSVSVNVHIIVSEKQTVLCPASVQLIELHKNQLMYRGADFISFRDLSDAVKNEVQVTASKIADILRKKGYKGVAGIDMLVFKNEVYFLEVNPRFQASSILIDRYLNERHAEEMQNRDKRKIMLGDRTASNLIELSKNAFSGIINTEISFYDEINYACYYYYADSNDHNNINEKLKLLNCTGIHVDADGFCEQSPTDGNSYLYRAVFSDRISQISPDGDLWISDNVKICDCPQDRLKLKIALLNQGVRIDGGLPKLKEGVFEAVDFYVNDYSFYVNSPKYSKWVELSPYALSLKNGQTYLTYYGARVSKADIETEKIDKQNDSYKSLFFSTDRVRISPTSGCQFKGDGTGCRFCEVNRFTREYTPDELKLAAEYALSTVKPRHIMIGGGTVKNLANLQTILDLAKFIRSKNPDMEITLMSVPPLIKDLSAIKQAGITDVSFNIEIFDEELAKQLMPAKSEYSRQYYLDVLVAAVKVWNGYGDVRSIVLVGLESTQSLLDGITQLKERHVQPVLSVFRPMKNSALAGRVPPSNDYLYNIYSRVTEMLAPAGFTGPKCEACRNNTLSI